jgi:hypothetical protein
MRLHHLIELLDTTERRREVDSVTRAGIARGRYIDTERLSYRLKLLDGIDYMRELILLQAKDRPQFDMGDMFDRLSDDDLQAFYRYGMECMQHDLLTGPFPHIILSFRVRDEDDQSADDHLMLIDCDEETGLFSVDHYIALPPGGEPEYVVGMAFDFTGEPAGNTDPGRINFRFGDLRVLIGTPSGEVAELDMATETASFLVAFLAILSADGAKIVTTPAPAALNKRRAKKGKPPIGEIREVRIVVGGKQYHASGEAHGSHRSPRLHWRRGHIRRLASGGITNVRPCLVGVASDGPAPVPSYRVVSAP